MGSVSLAYFQAALTEALKKIPLSLPSFAVSSPANWNFTGPGFLFDTGYAAFMFDLVYDPSIPDVPCGECALIELLIFSVNSHPYVVYCVQRTTPAVRGRQGAVAARFRTPLAVLTLDAVLQVPRMI